MSRRKIVAIALVFFSLTALVTVTILVSRGVREMRRDRMLRYAVEDIDSMLSHDRYEQAARRLDEFRGVQLNRAQWIRVLRRAHVVAEELENWTGFAALSERAGRRHDDDAELVALALLMRVRSGESVSLKDVPEGERFDSLRGRILLSRLNEGPSDSEAFMPARRRGDSAGELSSRISSPAVEAVVSAAYRESPDAQERAFNETGDVRFGMNAALLRLRAGDIEQAYEAAGAATEGMSARFRAELAVSAGEFRAAARLLRPRLEQAAEDRGDVTVPAAFLLGDVFLATGRYAEAVRTYRRVSASSWTPEVYQNVAYAARLRGEDPREHLKAGRARHPGNAELARALTLATRERDVDSAEAREVMAPFQESHPLIRLTDLVVFGDSAGPRSVRGLLWRMYNQARDAERPGALFGEYLAWHLTGIGDWDDLARVVGDGDGNWADFYRGVLAVERGSYDEAANHFGAVSAFRMAVSASYNHGILAAAAGDTETAVAALQRADERLRSVPRSSRSRERHSLVLEALGRVYLLKGDQETGYRMLSQAVKADPSNASARNSIENTQVPAGN